MMVEKIITDNIKYYMNKNNVTLEKLIEKTNFSKNDFDRIFNYELMISPRDLQEIGNVLGFTKKDIIKKIKEIEV